MKTNQIFIHIRSLALALLLVFFLFIVYKVFKASDFDAQDNSRQSTLSLNEGQSIDFIESFDVDGVKRNISIADQKVILHFWASWCAPCVTEMPELIDFAKLNKDVVIIAISQDSDISEIKSFIKSFPGMKNHFTILHDQNRNLAKKFQVSKLPESILINKSIYVKKVSGSIYWSQVQSFDSLID